ncbi:MAG TPA: hypothetical protein VM510_12130 [Caulifigura sp.]|nr:hypothetical protein [Caulifigura sp.]
MDPITRRPRIFAIVWASAAAANGRRQQLNLARDLLRKVHDWALLTDFGTKESEFLANDQR